MSWVAYAKYTIILDCLAKPFDVLSARCLKVYIFVFIKIVVSEGGMIEFLTALLVVLTGFYAWVTFKILKANEKVVQETQKQFETYIKPCIIVSVVTYTSNACLFLRVKNVGKSPASNLKLTLDRDFYKLGRKDEKRNLKNHPAFSRQIEMFAPEAELLFYLAQGFIIFGKDADSNVTPPVFSIGVKYDFSGKQYLEKVLVDLNPYIDSATPQDPVVSALGKIKEAIEKTTQD